MRVIFQFQCIHCGHTEESIQTLDIQGASGSNVYATAESVVEAATEAVNEVIEVFPDARVDRDSLLVCVDCAAALRKDVVQEIESYMGDGEEGTSGLLEDTEADRAMCEEQAGGSSFDESWDSFDNEYGLTQAEIGEIEAPRARDLAERKRLIAYIRSARKQRRAIKRAREARRFEFWGLDEPYKYEAEEYGVLLRAKARDEDLLNKWNVRGSGLGWSRKKRHTESRSTERAKARRRGTL